MTKWTEDRIQIELANRLKPSRIVALRAWLPAAIAKARARQEELESERQFLLLKIELDSELSLDDKATSFEQVERLEQEFARLSDSLEAFQEAFNALPPRERPNVSVEFR